MLLGNIDPEYFRTKYWKEYLAEEREVGLTGGWRKLRNQDLNNVRSSRNTTPMGYKKHKWNLDREPPLERRRVVQRGLGHEVMKWIYLAQKRIPWRALQSTSELSDSVSVGNFLTGSIIISCLKSLLGGVACYMFTQPTEVLLNICNTCTNCDMKISPHGLSICLTETRQ